MYIQLMVLMLIISGVLVFYKKEKNPVQGLNRSEHPLWFMYPFSAAVYRLFKKWGHADLFGNCEVLREIYIDEIPENSLKNQGCKCIASILAVISVTCFISFTYNFTYEAVLADGKYLSRNSAGRGSTDYELLFSNELFSEEAATVSVSEVRLFGDKLEDLRDKAWDYLDKVILNGNSTPDCVQTSLLLVKEIPDTGILVRWPEDNNWFVSADGSLKNDDFIEPVDVCLHAELTYFDEEWDYYLNLRIMPVEITPQEKFKELLSEALSEQDKKNPSESRYELPEKVGGYDVKWFEEENGTDVIFLLLGAVATIMIIPAFKQDIQKKLKKRNEQMMRDYSDIISKFVMLLTAGMTCRAAWTKIVSDYSRLKDREKVMHYAYEEMLISYNELSLGMPEARVYERFGNRCNLLVYQRFGTMLSRNLRRGSAGIIELLEIEARESFAERRDNVRRKGEETGTKLLIPMFGMLILVLAIVVVPAFSSFGI